MVSGIRMNLYADVEKTSFKSTRIESLILVGIVNELVGIVNGVVKTVIRR